MGFGLRQVKRPGGSAKVHSQARLADATTMVSNRALLSIRMGSYRQDEVVWRARARTSGKIREFRSQPPEPGPICFYVDADRGRPFLIRGGTVGTSYSNRV